MVFRWKRAGLGSPTWGRATVEKASGRPVQALGQATLRQRATKARVSPTCIQPSQARRRGRAGRSGYSVMPRTIPYRPGSDAAARIQVGTCAQGPETGWEIWV